MPSAPMDPPVVWRKSTRSGGAGDCVEVARLPTAVAVRDSKDPDGPVLEFATHAWRDFLGCIRAGMVNQPLVD
jgi:Domain of unknown function (DUF397)